MCHACVILTDKNHTEAETQYELAKALKMRVKDLPLLEGYTERSLVGNSCLCPIDMHKLGQMLKFDVTAPYENSQKMNDEWIFRPANRQ
ncbi:hypothetical protein WSS15_16870 [Acetobacter pasteurianus]|uniref:Uncharacterized protein n=1 Tax=Acetobacter pasteurianus NBRC 3278 TaxID=1226660 RepID=A0A401X860_ACEPA|nr:hypothetical protein [Acetobacter pasteurianus]GCD59965.1 hypothetical protein NBRC3277_2540 [Acetobacter pasteurianus NBRC 3277]QHM90050.1 hypothetical protein FCN51_00165 [Acetobacter pasteurianus]GCD63986.1 hypothetical protein NBRC3278_3079 [Acetobacter pasteurianus NBRC 3278]GCD70419.1 hypothetical protein NBRC3280_3054 [Acetobacter pasteurianus NBRC 3280]GLH29037.1 hypothetical protein WSS15_16870 [Acetobacter pasteurianus]